MSRAVKGGSKCLNGVTGTGGGAQAYRNYPVAVTPLNYPMAVTPGSTLTITIPAISRGGEGSRAVRGAGGGPGDNTGAVFVRIGTVFVKVRY